MAENNDKPLPSSVLFVCGLNSIRSPMAEGLMKSRFKDRVYIQSAGLEAGGAHELMVAVMGESGIDMSQHKSRSIQDLSDNNFDLVIALSPDVGDAMQAEFGDSDTNVEVWPVPDPTDGPMDVRALMDSFRAVKSIIETKIRKKFG